jgi:hypothetical protein
MAHIELVMTLHNTSPTSAEPEGQEGIKMKDTVTKLREQHEAEAKKMLREAMIICGTIIVLVVTIFVVLYSRQ